MRCSHQKVQFASTILGWFFYIRANSFNAKKRRRRKKEKKKRGAIPQGKGICRDLCIPSVPPPGPPPSCFCAQPPAPSATTPPAQVPRGTKCLQKSLCQGAAHVERGRCRAGMGEFFPHFAMAPSLPNPQKIPQADSTPLGFCKLSPAAV